MEFIAALQHGLPGLESVFLLITAFGSDIAFIALLSLYYSLTGGSGGRALGIAFGLSFVTNVFLKELLHLPRPYFLDPNLASAAAQATGTGPGLPSGHAQMTTTFWFARAARFGQAWLWGLAVIAVGLVSLSRLYLGVHFLQDVLVGLLLGICFAAIADGLERTSLPRVLPWVIAAVSLGLSLVGGKDLAQGFGLLAGFAFAREDFAIPRAWPLRIAIALLGLMVGLGLYIGSGAILGSLRQLPLIAFLRYLAMVLFAVQVWPLVLERTAGANA
jgi:membrane-associated phospholipid phosphatase